MDTSELTEAGAAERTVALLDEFGLAVLPSMLSDSETAALEASILAQLENHREKINHKWGAVREVFQSDGTVESGAVRFDDPIDAGEAREGGGSAPCAILTRLLRGVVGNTLAATLGAEAKLTEFSAMVPFHGAAAQGPHHDQGAPSRLLYPDSPKLREAKDFRFITGFVYAVDVGLDGGALDVWPGVVFAHAHHTRKFGNHILTLCHFRHPPV